jgi:hypothetical protein
MTTVMGRVRATVRLKSDTAGPPRVLETSWAADRSFPRLAGVGVPFEVETSDGQIYRVDPFEALVALPVRARTSRDGGAREEAWIEAHDELKIEGELEPAGRARLPPALRARRIEQAGPPALHRLPPRALGRGESEPIASEPIAPEPPAPEPIAAEPIGAEPPAAAGATPVSVEPEASVAPPSDASVAAPPAEPPSEVAARSLEEAPPAATEAATPPEAATLAPRRPKKKRPDSSGTPTPIQ